MLSKTDERLDSVEFVFDGDGEPLDLVANVSFALEEDGVAFGARVRQAVSIGYQLADSDERLMLAGVVKRLTNVARGDLAADATPTRPIRTREAREGGR